ncbi:UNVERIFIED_CONTAM: hypothetical protein ABIC26_002611 [Paenibacillus sp. PvR008]
MNIELAKKNFIDLKKKANDAVEKVGLGNQKAKVALVLDISGSMGSLFSNGTVQKVVENLLALGIKFDDNQAIDIFLFGSNNYDVGELKEEDFYQYVNNKIRPSYPLEGSTNYAGVMSRILKKYTSAGEQLVKKRLFNKLLSSPLTNTILDEPVFVIFITDGDNNDKRETEAVIKEASKHGVFWQFVGIGYSSFDFLQKLDDMNVRFIDNADFIKFNDIGSVDENELFSRLLGEFPEWLKEAKNKNLIK